jgi:hypothetical protein
LPHVLQSFSCLQEQDYTLSANASLIEIRYHKKVQLFTFLVERADITMCGTAEKLATGAESITFSKQALDILKKKKLLYSKLNDCLHSKTELNYLH